MAAWAMPANTSRGLLPRDPDRAHSPREPAADLEPYRRTRTRPAEIVMSSSQKPRSKTVADRQWSGPASSRHQPFNLGGENASSCPEAGLRGSPKRTSASGGTGGTMRNPPTSVVLVNSAIVLIWVLLRQAIGDGPSFATHGKGGTGESKRTNLEGCSAHSSGCSIAATIVPAYPVPFSRPRAASGPPCRKVSASNLPKMSIRLATTPVQPVWWLAPIPAPLSPWKYS
jgi:hypothetical protein